MSDEQPLHGDGKPSETTTKTALESHAQEVNRDGYNKAAMHDLYASNPLLRAMLEREQKAVAAGLVAPEMLYESADGKLKNLTREQALAAFVKDQEGLSKSDAIALYASHPLLPEMLRRARTADSVESTAPKPPPAAKTKRKPAR